MPVARNCASCLYCQEGRCRRYPPVLVPPPQIPYLLIKPKWEWPEVAPTASCGEYQPVAVVP
jgi:hypothetical protein